MKYIYTLIVIAITSFAIIIINPTTGFTNQSGAPAGNSGSPADGTNCSSCHGAVNGATTRAGLITSDIPATGYVPGNQYNITAMISEAGIAKFGFQVSTLFNNGARAGVMAKADDSTQLAGNNHITHTFAGTAATGNSRKWTFKWTAPVANSGPVSFYGAFVAANSNSSADGGDKVFISKLTASEAGHVGIASFEQKGMAIYPMPFNETLTVNKGHQTFEQATVKIFTLDGKQILETVVSNPETAINTANLARGMYIIHLDAPGVQVVQKIVK